MKYYDKYGGVHDRLFDALATNLGEDAKKFIQPKDPEIEEEIEIYPINEDVSLETNTESTEYEVKPSAADEIINADPIMIAPDESKIKNQSILNNSMMDGSINSINGGNTNIIAQG